MTKPAAKRIGRPFKGRRGPARVSLGLKVIEHTKRIIEELAKHSGRTQSQECEYLIQKALWYDSLRFAKLDVREGDRVLVSTDLFLDADQLTFVRDRIREWLPAGVQVNILSAGLTLQVEREGPHRYDARIAEELKKRVIQSRNGQ